MKKNLLTPEEIALVMEGSQWPPIMTMDQAADLLQIAKPTLYRWISEGRIKTSVRRRKPLRFWRDKLVEEIFNHVDN